MQKSYVNRLLFVGKFTPQLVLKPNYLFLVGLGEFKKPPQLVRIPNYHLFLEVGKLLHGGCYGSVFDD